MTTELDLSRADIPLWRLVGVELRKAVDTLAGRWLLISIAILTFLIDLFLLWVSDYAHTMTLYMGLPNRLGGQGLLLGVVGILLATSEWTQRTGMVTFTLAPKRIMTVIAKVIAAMVLATGLFVVAYVIAAFLTAVSGNGEGWDLSLAETGRFYLATMISTLSGVAFGLLLLNTPAAIVAYILSPIVVGSVTTFWDKAQDADRWVNLNAALEPVYRGLSLGAEMWAQIGTAATLWLVLPLLVGAWRVVNAEVK